MFDLTNYKPKNNFMTLFDDFFNDDSFLPTTKTNTHLIKTNTYLIKTDIIEEDDKFVIKADMPGLKKDDVDINIKDNILSIKAERKDESVDEKKNYIKREIFVGKVERTFSLPNNVDSDKISAEMIDGQLLISIPKSEKIKPKQIKIK
jgi:HSP20 family protein